MGARPHPEHSGGLRRLRRCRCLGPHHLGHLGRHRHAARRVLAWCAGGDGSRGRRRCDGYVIGRRPARPEALPPAVGSRDRNFARCGSHLRRAPCRSHPGGRLLERGASCLRSTHPGDHVGDVAPGGCRSLALDRRAGPTASPGEPASTRLHHDGIASASTLLLPVRPAEALHAARALFPVGGHHRSGRSYHRACQERLRDQSGRHARPATLGRPVAPPRA